MLDEALPRIGSTLDDPLPTAFELVLDDHIQFVDPKAYGLDYEGIKPLDYFITSGDAVQKAQVLETDLWQHAGELRKKAYMLIATEKKCDVKKAQKLFRTGIRPKNPPKFSIYEEAIWKAAGQARKLVQALKKARGTHIFAETEWIDHKLCVVAKDPRM